MKTVSRPRSTLIGCLLSAASGAVDVVVFTGLGHVFASVITGNVVVIGVGLGSGDLTVMSHAAVAVVAYAVGVASAAGFTRSTRSATRRLVWLYTVELVALACVAALWIAADAHPGGASRYVALILAAGAMGVQTRAFALVGVPGLSSTYFTGTLTGLLTDLVVDGHLRRSAAIGLVSLLAGASASGALVSHLAVAAPLLPLALVAAVLILTLSRPRRPGT
ncbi:YoaK family protein [Williamsia sp. MIQD14]|uniref:YoaK family protein n=1 Tax=Williamsia sp. MIQD14 TaxID=3425703 RepID=UPI003DA1C1FD